MKPYLYAILAVALILQMIGNYLKCKIICRDHKRSGTRILWCGLEIGGDLAFATVFFWIVSASLPD